jgi:hypothetical protein
MTPMTVDAHPALAALALLILAWFLHRALRPCGCCAHRNKHNPEDFR